MNYADKNIRQYPKDGCVFFRKTKEQWGGYSNMASGYPLLVNNISILTSEALYQVCRFPHMPDVQEKILEQKSPMTAKMTGKPFRSNSRPDWDFVRLKIMRWCLRVKLLQNFDNFSQLLLSSNNFPIVEWSLKDDYWGAKLYDGNVFIGKNALGRLLMELRQELQNGMYDTEYILEPLQIDNFYLLGKPIDKVIHVKKNKDFKGACINNKQNDGQLILF